MVGFSLAPGFSRVFGRVRTEKLFQQLSGMNKPLKRLR